MLKKLGLMVIFSLFISPSFALSSCPRAVPTNDSMFCSSFESVAQCYCQSRGLPRGMCDMKQVYNRMLALFNSIENACAYQKDTSYQDCIDNWSCYLKGGMDSQGKICSADGKSCSGNWL